MAANPTVQELLKRNNDIAATHKPQLLIPEMKPPNQLSPNMLIVCCMDPRSVPEEFLGLDRCEAVVIRVAGGRITPALPGIIGIDTLLNFRETMIIHHTDCGCSYMQDPNVREALKERAPAEASKIDGMVFGAFDNLEQSVRDDLEIFKSSQFVREEMKKSVYGFVYDIQTGKLTGVAERLVPHQA